MDLFDGLQDLDGNLTRKEVERNLEKFRLYKLKLVSEKMPKVTPEYSIIPPSNTNAFHSSTEDAAIANADLEKMSLTHIHRVSKAINKLSQIEREIIVRCYLQEEQELNYEIYNDLSFSERKYSRIKRKAIYKLAFALGCEVYKAEGIVQ